MKNLIDEMLSPEFVRDIWHDHVPSLSSYTFLGYKNAPEKYVYFIRCGDFIKIGCSATPEERVEQLRRGGKAERPSAWDGNPYLVGYLPGDHQKEAEQHKAWSHLRDRGEWFHSDEELVVFAENVRIRQAETEVQIHEKARQQHCENKGIELTSVDLDAITQKHLTQNLSA